MSLRYYLTVENDMDEVMLETEAPTLELLSEKVIAWQTKNGIQEPDDVIEF